MVLQKIVDIVREPAVFTKLLFGKLNLFLVLLLRIATALKLSTVELHQMLILKSAWRFDVPRLDHIGNAGWVGVMNAICNKNVTGNGKIFTGIIAVFILIQLIPVNRPHLAN